MLKTCHPQIQVEDTDYFYDLETFNTCEVTGSLLLTLACWERVHPSLITIPVNWNYKVSYGLLYAKKIEGRNQEIASCVLATLR